KARAQAARRQAKEMLVPNVPDAALVPAGLEKELREVFDRELLALPEKYRVPIILCELEEKSEKEAARELGWPQGTLSGRLSGAKALLAKRLARRGVVVSAGAPAAAAAPASAVSAAVKVARISAAGRAAAPGVILPEAVALAEGVLGMMVKTKIK